MKKISVIVIAILGVLLSCSPEKMPEGKQIGPNQGQQGKDNTATISLGKNSLSFEASSSSETVSVTANVNWTAECSDSWVTVSKNSSTELSVSVSSNTSTARTSNIYIKEQGKSATLATINVSQAATVQYDISSNLTSLSFTADGGSQSVAITSNFAWETVSKPSWITLSPSSGSSGSTTLSITAVTSTSTTDRTGTITLGKSSSAIVSISVSQTAVASVWADKSFTVTGNGKTVTFTMKYVEGGTFNMGSDDSDAFNDEQPVHQVTLSSYLIGETEVTQDLWYAVMGLSPTSNIDRQWIRFYGLGDNYPAYYISYNDCLEFIAKLNSLTGQQFRIPTEAEWEFAARGGNKSNGYKYSGSNTIDNVAWHHDNSNVATHPAKGKTANELGLYDMSGNVGEWCSDWYYFFYSSTAQMNPTGPSTGSARVARGGTCGSFARGCRVSCRFGGNAPDKRDEQFGLRLVLQ